MTIGWAARACRPTATRLAVAAATAMVTLVPAPASAQTATMDRAPMKIGPVEVTPRLVFSNMGIDNNVFNEADNPKRDFTLTAAPDVQLAVNPGRFHLSYTGGAELVYFKKYTSERSVNRSFSARVDADLASFRPFASVTASHTRARMGSEIDVRGRRHPRRYTVGSIFKLTSKTSLGVSAERTSEKFDEGIVFRDVDLSTTLNNDGSRYEMSMGLALTTLTSLTVAVSREQLRFPGASNRDSETVRIAPTFSFSPFGILAGTASVGYRRFNGLDPSLADYSGLVALGTLGVTIADRFKVDTSFSRDVNYSYEDRVPYYVLTGGRATVATLLAAGLDVRVTGGRDTMGYRPFAGDPAPGKDLLTLYGGGVGYHVKDNVLVVVQAEFTNRSSEREHSRGFKNHRITATLNWGASGR